MLQLRCGATIRIIALTVVLSASKIMAADICAVVMDLERLPLPSASLNATSLTTGKTYVAQTDKTGRACISHVPEGLYAVDASLRGFLHAKYYPVRAVPKAKQSLSFWLPLGEINEGGVGHESTLSGTLANRGIPVEAAEICVIGISDAQKICTMTDELGEYALVAPSGEYQVKIRAADGHIYESRVDMSSPGIYRNRLSVNGISPKPQ